MPTYLERLRVESEPVGKGPLRLLIWASLQFGLFGSLILGSAGARP